MTGVQTCALPIWSFDETAGTTAEDSSPSLPPNPGTLLAGASRITGFGTAGTYSGDGALRFDGSSQYVSVPHQSSLNFTASEFCALAWVKVQAPVSLVADTDVYPILAKWDTASAGGFDLVLKGGAGNGIAFRIYGANGAVLKEINPTTSQVAKLLNGSPHLIAFVRGDDNVGRVYLDGVEVGALNDASGTLTSSAPLWIGANAAGKYLAGDMDDVRLYSSPLRADEIQAIYAAFDSDNDGMADVWEMAVFSTLGRDGSADDDGDGFTDREEYVNGTDPNDFFNGATVEVNVVSGDNQFGPAGALLSESVVFELMEKTSTGDVPMANIPVTITAPSSGSLV